MHRLGTKRAPAAISRIQAQHLSFAARLATRERRARRTENWPAVAWDAIDPTVRAVSRRRLHAPRATRWPRYLAFMLSLSIKTARAAMAATATRPMRRAWLASVVMPIAETTFRTRRAVRTATYSKVRLPASRHIERHDAVAV